LDHEDGWLVSIVDEIVYLIACNTRCSVGRAFSRRDLGIGWIRSEIARDGRLDRVYGSDA
jgi:hypothetical protein